MAAETWVFGIPIVKAEVRMMVKIGTRMLGDNDGVCRLMCLSVLFIYCFVQYVAS